ncbi:MAG: hypothetical protein U0176_14240 [Bacteroidia bacterium]
MLWQSRRRSDWRVAGNPAGESAGDDGFPFEASAEVGLMDDWTATAICTAGCDSAWAAGNPAQCFGLAGGIYLVRVRANELSTVRFLKW